MFRLDRGVYFLTCNLHTHFCLLCCFGGFFLSPLAKTPASGFISSAIEGTVLNRDVAFSVRAN